MAARSDQSTGLQLRHRKTCVGRREDGRCCGDAWQAQVFDAVTGRRSTKAFPSKAAAKRWRGDARSAIRDGTLQASTRTTVAEG